MLWLILLLFDIPDTWLSCILCVLVASAIKPQHIKNILWGTATALACWAHAQWYHPLPFTVLIPIHFLLLL